jgi:V8-like Glu-specific endopeptidase
LTVVGSIRIVTIGLNLSFLEVRMSIRHAPIAAVALAAAITLTACDTPASTQALLAPTDHPSLITNGTLDGNAHPAVVLMVLDSAGSPAYRCSGTLFSPTIVVTAGHCTGEPGEFSGMRVFTESDVQHGNNNYPLAGPNTVEAKAWHSHPLFTEALFFLHDVGVIELNAPVTLAQSAYGVLPGVDDLDALKPRASTIFTSVGYGVQRINPVKLVADKVRMTAEPHLVQINTGYTGLGSLVLSNNASTGGTCFGDSGGPNFLGTSNVVAGVTSFGKNGSCGGTGGVFRLDRKDVVDFVSLYLK